MRRMTSPLTPRGPDGEGFHVAPGIALGHRRLSIIDLAGGAQPMRSNDKRYHIVYNGEVYNYVELRAELEQRGCVFHTQSDTEVLLNQFVLDGVDALQLCNGMFAVAIWDRDEERLFLARDRIGIKPLYYCVRDRELIFASELKALLAHPRVDRRLNALSVSKYFTYGYIPAPHTIFEDVHKLEPGGYLFFNRNGLGKNRYWDIPLEDNPVSERNVDEWAEDLLAILRDSVTKQLRSDVPVGLFLSGGLDSSTVTALAGQQSGNRLHSFSIGFDHPSYDESPYARRIAELFGTEHHEEILTMSQATELFPQIMPAMIFSHAGEERVRDDDVVLFFNFRADRARQLSQAFLFDKFDDFDRGRRPRVHFVTLTQYDVTYPSPYIFTPEKLVHILGEVASAAGKTQLRIAETEKYPHVTYFFNGGIERAFPGEDRKIIPSPKVATYDLQPEMSALSVTDEVCARMANYDLIILNFANPDMSSSRSCSSLFCRK